MTVGKDMHDLSLVHELKLVSEIVATIERFKTHNGIEARPEPLRDTMLKVAALLHSEAVRLESGDQGFEPLRDSFLERAHECLAGISSAPSYAKSQLQ